MNHVARRFRLLVASGITASLFLALVLAVAPDLHERLHQSDATAQHECAATLVASGKYQESGPQLVVAPHPVIPFSNISTQEPAWVPGCFLRARIFEHAPPRFLGHSV